MGTMAQSLWEGEMSSKSWNWDQTSRQRLTFHLTKKKKTNTCKGNGTALNRFVIVCQTCVPKTPYLKVVGIIHCSVLRTPICHVKQWPTLASVHHSRIVSSMTTETPEPEMADKYARVIPSVLILLLRDLESGLFSCIQVLRRSQRRLIFNMSLPICLSKNVRSPDIAQILSRFSTPLRILIWTYDICKWKISSARIIIEQVHLLPHHVLTSRPFRGHSKVLRASLGQRMPFGWPAKKQKHHNWMGSQRQSDALTNIIIVARFDRYLLRQHTLPIDNSGWQTRQLWIIL